MTDEQVNDITRALGQIALVLALLVVAIVLSSYRAGCDRRDIRDAIERIPDPATDRRGGTDAE